MSAQEVRIRGWIPVVSAADLPDGGVMPIRVQGDDLVLWRGDSGAPHALEAFCQHLGAHLGYGGRVRGEDIRCFYHGWTWSPAGENTDIPYDDRVHRGRRIRRWYAEERNGEIFIWHPGSGPGGEPDRPAPEMPREAERQWVSRDLVVDVRLVVEALVEPATAGLLPSGPVVDSQGAPGPGPQFRVSHRCKSSESIEVTVFDVALIAVTSSQWTLTLAVAPVVDGTATVRSTVSVAPELPPAEAEESARALSAAVAILLELASDMRYSPLPEGAGEEPLRSYRAWNAGLGQVADDASDERLVSDSA